MLQYASHASGGVALHHGGNTHGSLLRGQPQRALVDKILRVLAQVAHRGQIDIQPQVRQKTALFLRVGP